MTIAVAHLSSPGIDASVYASKFTGRYEHRIIKGGSGTIFHSKRPRPSLKPS